jgi:hypothetical protein
MAEDQDKKVNVVRVPSPLFANSTSAIVHEIIVHPFTFSVVSSGAGYSPDRAAPAPSPAAPSPSPEAPPPSRPKEIILDQRFKLVFLTITALTVGAALLNLGMIVFLPSPTPSQVDFMQHLTTAWVGGLGAIFGLLGGKSL